MNREQRRAVLHREGPCLVLAGPGSGKTFTIVSRVKHLVERCGVRPEEILVITFTRYAAAEMKSRLRADMGEKASPITAGTFHGVFYGILKWAYGITGNCILSEQEKLHMIREELSEWRAQLFDEEETAKELSAEIGRLKNSGSDISAYSPVKCDVEMFREVFEQYERKRRGHRKLDFDDILISCRSLFVSRPDALKRWQDKFRYILVDEFQDVNRVQYDVLRMLARPEDNLFVVGDDDQSIYGFRGADASLMFQFKEDYPAAEQIVLGTNYRSTGHIVSLSLRIIGHNTRRFPKALSAAREPKDTVHIQEVKDSAEEAWYVAEQVKRKLSSGVKAGEIAVLYRNHVDGEAVAECFLREGIPFLMKEGAPNLYEHFAAKDIISYLRLGIGRGGRADFLRVMNRPVRYISRESLEGEGSFEDMRRFYSEKEWMQDRIDQFEADVKILGKMSPYAAIQYVRRSIGYDQFLKEYAQSRNADYGELTEVLCRLEESARAYSTIEEWIAHGREYSEYVKRQRESGERGEDGVRLMTIHGSKGLEFDTVFLIQAVEGTIPHRMAERDADTEEERRLFYVAMTRAKNTLKICYPKIKNGKVCVPSRFVDELLSQKDV